MVSVMVTVVTGILIMTGNNFDPMKKVMFCAVLLLILASLSAACISPQEKAPVTATPLPPTQPVTATSAPAIPHNELLVPGPTQIPPPNLEVTYDVMKDSVYAYITVTCRGGAGLYLLQGASVKVTRADGTTSDGVIPPRVGANFITNGTRQSDRVEITAL
jgi:hypothetical protein